MQKRFAVIWFRYLTTDWLTLRRPELQNQPFVFSVAERGKKVISGVNPVAAAQGLRPGLPLADAETFVPHLQVFEEKPGREANLLKALGEWCIRYAPVVALDAPDGLFLDISGCTHLWGGEEAYLKEINTKFKSKGYQVRVAIADTIGAAWAIAHFGTLNAIIESGEQANALLPLAPAALRLEAATLQRLHKLGLHQVRSFIGMPKSVLRRRFGDGLILRLAQALGRETEVLVPLQVPLPYQERLPSMEPIRTATGIEIAIRRLLEGICSRLKEEGKGLRTAVLTCYRVDGKVIEVNIGTNAPSHHAEHLFKLFQLKISSIRPALGIELFLLDAPKVEALSVPQEALWSDEPGLNNQQVTELLDRFTVKLGAEVVRRYLPDEHYWPEHSIKPAGSVLEQLTSSWQRHKLRPTQLLANPEQIEVAAPVPDYPPMLFRYKGQVHYIKKADGPERIEREWWLDSGAHRDYYSVEDEEGKRYWLFRLGHYTGDKSQNWFIHGYFA
ncbi:DNA polymerase Y family protein [Pedobacter sp. MC2016-14]|uniref:Y-family DNA polymerase n=1 Tax=Pedobacter sp. MC2016-14 TaxID=2897327 RepID=UPI001E4C4CDE|nr:DNA polymerase Y family protein [Pedobacter sp. MC2016-14]MCD0488874.1 DNA polymerase Y family protein [Pedobacter sp. MC2016-14]